MRIATFNANSIRMRLPVILAWLEKFRPDVLAVQETKTPDASFPLADIEAAGWRAVFRGEKGYNGVAFLSRQSLQDVRFGLDDEPRDETRVVSGRLGRVHIVNTYVPQGRDITHEMYAYKLEWFRRLRGMLDRRYDETEYVVWLGDLNVAAEPLDVHSPELYGRHVCFHEAVRRAFAECRKGRFHDVVRERHPGERLYSFFDYRTPRAVQRNIGWRLDYILATPKLATRCAAAGIDVEPRREPQSSDHTFVWADFDA
jgi:exodeoxyribonuclease-3